MDHPHREASLTVTVNSKIPWRGAKEIIETARKELEKLGTVEITSTPREFRKPI
jgi:hypothetical protein